MPKFPYRWNLKDGYPAKGIKPNNKTVFGTFVCGGGSTMGYKLAGYTHLGGVELDPKLARIYEANHKPKLLYTEDIRLFNQREDLPDELFNLDLLDGSPPCSTFSLAGDREKQWGRDKKFLEGQKVQVLDDLVFVYCDTILKLRPKTFILENVKGIISGNAKVYSREIVKKLSLDYNVQIFCLNAASMGVPQRRERVFFIGHLRELQQKKLKLEFNEKPIFFHEYRTEDGGRNRNGSHSATTKNEVRFREPGDKNLSHIAGRLKGVYRNFNTAIVADNVVAPTLVSGAKVFRYFDSRIFSKSDYLLTGAYPMDFDFGEVRHQFVIGMSVPPVMTAQIAYQINKQWLSKLK